jgi:hypothetical protein
MEALVGVYCYTLRARTKEIGGHRIGRFAFAYKASFFCSEGWYRGASLPVLRMAARFEAQAQAARDKIGDVRLAIMGDFTSAKDEPMAVYEVGTDLTSFLDSHPPGPVVGHIRKIGRSYEFSPVEAP